MYGTVQLKDFIKDKIDGDKIREVRVLYNTQTI